MADRDNRPVRFIAAAAGAASIIVTGSIVGLHAVPARAQTQICSMSASTVYKKTADAVVFIATRRINPYRVSGRIERALGSGFIIDQQGLIVTNSHVVFGANSMLVTLDDGTTLPAELVAADPIFDIAIIRVKPPRGTILATIQPADSADVSVGDEVIAIGNPLGLEQTLTTGVVSGLNRILPESPFSSTRRLIQTDAAINPGNSGGPLLDRCGRVVGINTAIIPDAQNVGFAIPIDLVKEALPSLLENGRIIRPWVGFHGQFVDEGLRTILNIPIVSGLLVEVVEPESPAAKNGIRGGQFDLTIGGNELLLGGDVITAINGVAIDSAEAMQRAMSALKTGQRLSLKSWRSGVVRQIQYHLPERPLLPGDLPD